MASGEKVDDYYVFWVLAVILYVVVASVAGLGYREARRRLAAHSNASKQRKWTGSIMEAGSTDENCKLEDNDELNIKFHEEAIQTWSKASYLEKITKAATNLQFMTGFLIIYRTVRNILASDCVGFDGGVFTWPPPPVETVEYCGFLALMWQSNRCRQAPHTWLYWVLIFVFNAYIPSCILWPLQWSCMDLKQESCRHQEYWYIKEAVLFCDCSLQGVTATLMIMTWILVQPWAMLRLQMIHMMWVWLFGVYGVWTMLARFIIHIKVFTFWDVVGRLVILSFAIGHSTMRKYYLEESEKKKFIYDLKQREASEKIFHVFEYMVPVHVVLPMLQRPGEPIADPVEKVTIMFIIISGFDKLAEKSKPEELLDFLNKIFTHMDEACTDNGVTKIETVGEEYVACVGVVPADIQEARQHGHGRILGRLFRAGDAILQLQGRFVHPLLGDDEVRFKMGLHTGPIVAGVIGKKLPRYRLFGDTINTAARMMQKGEVGHMQFGDATHAEMPPFVEAHLRGEVEMKGKGKVNAYIFDGIKLAPVDAKASVASLASGKRPRATSASAARKTRSYKKSISHAILALPEDSPSTTLLDQGCEEAGASQDDLRSIDSDATTRTQSCGFEFQHKDPELFKEVVNNLQSERSQSWAAKWGLRKKFAPDMETEWFKWFHEKAFTKKFDVRLNRQIIFLLGLTLFDIICGSTVATSKRAPPGMDCLVRFFIFLGFRCVTLALVLWWRYAWKMWPEWISNEAFKVQTGMMLTICLQLILIYASYDALTYYDTPGAWNFDEEASRDWTKHKAPPDQIFLPSFVLVYAIFAQIHTLPFWLSVPYIVLAVLLVSSPKLIGGGSMFFSLSGKMLFVINSVLNSLFAHEEEKSSRERYTAQKAVTETQERTELILNTLMPPLVVDQLRKQLPSAPPPSHEYSQATIAQSDLCGFTQLSATRTPHEVVEFVSDLFGMFDVLTDKYGIYKVETVGDAYIAGQAEAPLTEVNKPVSVVMFGLDMIDAVHKWSDRLAGDHEPVSCRVGIHHGECIGGIVGTDMQRYHIFGGLMSVVEVLESTGKPAMVQLSPACHEAVKKSMVAEQVTGLTFVERADTDLRTSKGEMHEYSEVGGRTYLISRGALGELPGAPPV